MLQGWQFFILPPELIVCIVLHCVLAQASSAAPAAPAERPMPEESLVDRLTRFSGILRQCAAEGPARDLDRVIRVLDKLDKVRYCNSTIQLYGSSFMMAHFLIVQVRVTGADLIKSGVGKTVAELRRHASPGISDRAGALRKLWTAVVVSPFCSLLCVTLRKLLSPICVCVFLTSLCQI